MKKFRSATAVAAVALGLTLSIQSLPAAANPVTGARATCNYGTTVYDWSNRDPRDCTNHYWVFDSKGQPILHIKPTYKESPVWTALKTGYNATQNWCSSNSATCGIITSAGVTFVFTLLTNRN